MKSLGERLRKVFRLPAAERAVLAQAWGLFLVVDLALRVLSFKRLLALRARLCRAERPNPAARPPSMARLAWLVEVAGRYVPVNATCLKKALVLSWLLGRRGIATVLRIGVARQGNGLVAHAWLDCDGQPVFGDQEIAQHGPLPAALVERASRMK